MTEAAHDPVDGAVSLVPQRTALEFAFPAAMLSEVGTKESWRKEVHRPATSTHKWWAKRLGTVFRGIITSATTDADSDPVVAYGEATDLSGAVVLDPFSGSGVTAVEAAKLGARPVAFDINPVATLVERQALQQWDQASLRSLFHQIEAVCREEIDRVHSTEDGRTVLYYFWVATVDCPDCDAHVRLFDSTVYSKNAYPKRVPKAQIVCPQCLDVQEGRYDFDSATCVNGHTITQHGPVSRTSMTCPNGHTHRVLACLNGDIPRFEMFAKMVTDAQGKTYEAITDWDRRLYAECESLLANLSADAVLPNGSLAPGNNTDQAIKWNFTNWSQFFNARQLYSLSLIATAIRDLPGGTAEREALCALFSGTLEFNNRFTSFKGEGTGAVRHMFSHHILKPERTPLEAHPWGTPQSSGSFSTLLKSRLERAWEYKQQPVDLVVNGDQVVREAGISKPIATQIHEDWESFSRSATGAYVATMNSASTDLPDASVDLVVTDPPYMDNVHYAELADFFHAWLKSMQPYSGYPGEDTTRRSGEVQHADPTEFGKAIEAVWAECARVVKPGGMLAFTFHQARVIGWVRVIESLRSAGWCVTAVQPVKGEMTTSVVKRGAREPSNLDSVVVCRRTADGAHYPDRSMPEAFRTATNRLERLLTSGVEVGSGDVRSVIRGSLLACLASSGGDLEASVEVVDSYADTAISQLIQVQ